MSSKMVLSKPNRYFPSSGRPTACPTMTRNSPTVVVVWCSWNALRVSSATRFSFCLRICFLSDFAHFLDQRLDNFSWSLRGAAAESNATNAMQDGGSATPALEHAPSRTLCELPAEGSLTAGLLTAGALATAGALEHMPLRVLLLPIRAVAATGALEHMSLRSALTMAAIKSGLQRRPTGVL